MPEAAVRLLDEPVAPPPAARTDTSILPVEARDLCFEAGGRRLIDGIDLALEAGTRTVIVGSAIDCSFSSRQALLSTSERASFRTLTSASTNTEGLSASIRSPCTCCAHSAARSRRDSAKSHFCR